VSVNNITVLIITLWSTLYSLNIFAENEENMKVALDIDIAWGGYYSNLNEDGKISIFRLLDFNSDAYHATLFQETFDTMPDLNTVKELKPFVGHVPLDTRGLLHRTDVKLLGHEILSMDDLIGYKIYRESNGWSTEEIEELANKVLSYSKGAPLPIHLEMKDGSLEVTINE
jgi:hypothetical protein